MWWVVDAQVNAKLSRAQSACDLDHVDVAIKHFLKIMEWVWCMHWLFEALQTCLLPLQFCTQGFLDRLT
jgi:hypothetical protein